MSQTVPVQKGITVMGRLVFTAFSVVLFTQACGAQTPQEVAKAYMEGIQQEKWQEVSDLLAPEALEEFREMTWFYQESPHADRITKMFFGDDATPETVAAMSDAEYFAALAGTTLGRAKRRGLAFKEVTVIGSVAEGERTVHVVTRLKVQMGEAEMETMEVGTCVLTDDGWKIGLDKQWKGMALAMKAQLDK